MKRGKGGGGPPPVNCDLFATSKAEEEEEERGYLKRSMDLLLLKHFQPEDPDERKYSN